MSFDTFDYGGDDESAARATKPLSEFDDLLGTSGAERARAPAHNSLLANLDMRVMVQVVVAVVLLIVASGIFARDAWARQARDTAFRQMTDAQGRREYLRVIEGAEKFLTHQPLNGGNDPRAPNVVNLYSEALVHWVAQQPALDDGARAHIKRYEQLVKNMDGNK
jgi:hypothetical protein